MPRLYRPVRIPGRTIVRLRSRYAETQATFARRLDVARRTLVRWERGGAAFDSCLDFGGVSVDRLRRLVVLARAKRVTLCGSEKCPTCSSASDISSIDVMSHLVDELAA